jgi:Tol biopolymer transport system component
VVQTENVELSPSVSRDGKLIAYVVVKENKTEVWTAAIDGTSPTFRAVGSEPRITPDGFHLLYTHADLQGNEDIWRVDLRNGANDQITDADEIDVAADPSPDARWIAFASTRGVAPSIWVVPSSGGKRLRLNNGGYGPRFSPDSRSILYWDRGAFSIMDADGTRQHSAGLDPTPTPAVGAWSKSGPLQVIGYEIRGPNRTVLFKSERPIWPEFDVMPDGRFIFSPINILETGLWAIDLQFRNQ